MWSFALNITFYLASYVRYDMFFFNTASFFMFNAEFYLYHSLGLINKKRHNSRYSNVAISLNALSHRKSLAILPYSVKPCYPTGFIHSILSSSESQQVIFQVSTN